MQNVMLTLASLAGVGAFVVRLAPFVEDSEVGVH